VPTGPSPRVPFRRPVRDFQDVGPQAVGKIDQRYPGKAKRENCACK